MCGLKTNLDVLSEDELDEIAKFKEDCAKKNKTREEHLEDLRKSISIYASAIDELGKLTK